MKVIKIILGSVLGLLALGGWLGVLNRLFHLDGSAYATGGLAGSIAMSLLVTAGSVALFKSAFRSG